MDFAHYLYNASAVTHVIFLVLLAWQLHVWLQPTTQNSDIWSCLATRVVREKYSN